MTRSLRRALLGAVLSGAMLSALACSPTLGAGPEQKLESTPKASGKSKGRAESSAPAAAEPAVRVGLEVLEREEAPYLRGKALGLVVHGASRTFDGRHTIDVLRGLDQRVVRLFSPEHGLRGEAAAGEVVADGVDVATGLPIISLYGKQRRPSPEDLKGLDALVFDLQGAGVRFYTYVSTLILSLEAAAEADLDFVVLDRPNPLGGERVEGPVSAPREVVPSSFVNLAPGPLVHGLTLGEMARHVNAHLAKPANLRVVPMEGWRRSMTWTATGRPWTPPSPNLRSPEAALAYPGIALLEGTNVSEGRGTATPFLLLGAPWLEKNRLPEFPGFRLLEATFTPTGSLAAPNPKFKDEVCNGWRVQILDAAQAQPYRLGLTLLRDFSQRPGFEWRREGKALTWLLGTPATLNALRAGKTVEQVLALDEADHAVWRQERASALLY